MYEKVIIPTDGSDCAKRGVEEGLWMAKTLGVKAIALYIIDASEYEGLHHESIKTSVKTGLKKVGEESLEAVIKRGNEWGVDVEPRIVLGKPYQEIIKAGNENDVIYISSHGASGWTKLFVGSTTDKVIKHARCTVAVVRGKFTK